MVWPKEEDAAESLYYEGGTQIVLFNVDEVVEELDLRAWIKAGMYTENQPIKRAQARVDAATKQMEKIDKQIANIPYMEVSTQIHTSSHYCVKAICLSILIEWHASFYKE